MAATTLPVECVGVTAEPALHAVELELVTEDSSTRFLLGPAQVIEVVVDLLQAHDRVVRGDPKPVPPAGPLSATF